MSDDDERSMNWQRSCVTIGVLPIVLALLWALGFLWARVLLGDFSRQAKDAAVATGVVLGASGVVLCVAAALGWDA